MATTSGNASSPKYERKLLALMIRTRTGNRLANNVNLDLFHDPNHRTVAELIQKYIKKHKGIPTKGTLKDFAEILSKNNLKRADAYEKALRVLNKLPKVKEGDLSFVLDKLEDHMTTNKRYIIYDKVKEMQESGEYTGKEIYRFELAELLKIQGISQSKLRYVSSEEAAKEQAEAYKNACNKDNVNMIPFNVDSLDQRLKGLSKPSLNLIYAKTGGGKTRTMVSIAYNAMMSGRSILYFTFETAAKRISDLFVARIGQLDSAKIKHGKLNKAERIQYSKILKDIHAGKYSYSLVEIAQDSQGVGNGIQTVDIEEHLETYKAINGGNPDLVIIDYANLTLPMEATNTTSDTFSAVFKEYNQMAINRNVAILTGTQESRTAAMAELDAGKKNKEIDPGVHHIGLSHYMATHCELVIHIVQTIKDRLNNRVNFWVEKNRDDKSGYKIPLIADWSICYVGEGKSKNIVTKV